MYILYTKPDCQNCDKAKVLLDLHKKEYRVIVLGIDMPVDDFRKQYPGVRTMPFVSFGSKEFGSLIRLAGHLLGKDAD